MVDTSVTPDKYVYDANGNILGGVRTPYVDVPNATYDINAEPGAPAITWSWMRKVPFSHDKLWPCTVTMADT